MQCRHPTQELHQYRQSAALLTKSAIARQAFLESLLTDAELCEAARRSFLRQLQNQQVAQALFQLAAEESLSTVLRAAFRQLDRLLEWNPDKGDLATWWGRQALYEFNNDGRRQAEKSRGYWRSTEQQFCFVSTSAASLEETELQIADPKANPVEQAERQVATQELNRLLATAADQQAVYWLLGWLEAEALHASEPVRITACGPQVIWRYGLQKQQAQQAGVSERTMRTRTRRVENMLFRLQAVLRSSSASDVW